MTTLTVGKVKEELYKAPSVCAAIEQELSSPSPNLGDIESRLKGVSRFIKIAIKKDPEGKSPEFTAARKGAETAYEKARMAMANAQPISRSSCLPSLSTVAKTAFMIAGVAFSGLQFRPGNTSLVEMPAHCVSNNSEWQSLDCCPFMQTFPEEVDKPPFEKIGTLPADLNQFIHSLQGIEREDFYFDVHEDRGKGKWIQSETPNNYNFIDPAQTTKLHVDIRRAGPETCHNQTIINISHRGESWGVARGPAILGGYFIDSQEGLTNTRLLQGLMTVAGNQVFIYIKDTIHIPPPPYAYGLGGTIPLRQSSRAVVLNLEELGMTQKQFMDIFANRIETSNPMHDFAGQGSTILPLRV